MRDFLFGGDEMNNNQNSRCNRQTTQERKGDKVKSAEMFVKQQFFIQDHGSLHWSGSWMGIMDQDIKDHDKRSGSRITLIRIVDDRVLKYDNLLLIWRS